MYATARSESSGAEMWLPSALRDSNLTTEHAPTPSRPPGVARTGVSAAAPPLTSLQINISACRACVGVQPGGAYR